MNEPTIYTDEQAALCEVHVQACALAQRYGHACDELLEAGELRDLLNARREELQALCDTLEARIRENGLLPHDFNVDREDLARLADRFREWLDHERHAHLQQALADREAGLLEWLETLQEAGVADDTITAADAAGRRMIALLE